MKKVITILLAMVLATSCLTGCGGKNAEKIETQDSFVKEESENDAFQESEAEENKIQTKVIDMDNAVWMDNEEIKITVKDIEIGGEEYVRVLVNATVENKTQEDFTNMEGAWINGLGSTVGFDTGEGSTFSGLDMKPGETKDVQITIKNLNPGPVEVTDLLLCVRSFENSYIHYMSEHLYPYGEDKAIVSERESKDTDVVILDNQSVTVTFLGHKQLEDKESSNTKFFVKNKTEGTLCFTTSEIYGNGEISEGEIYEFVPAGCSRMVTLYLDNDHFENVTFADLNNLQFDLWVLDVDGFTSEVFKDMKEWRWGIEEAEFKLEDYSVAKETCTIYMDGTVQLASADTNENINETTSSNTITYILDGVQYVFPTPVSELIENGWSLGDAGGTNFDPGAWYMIYMDKGEDKCLNNVVVMNRTDSSIRMDECTVMNIVIPFYSEVDFKLSNGLNLHSTESELKTICGEPEVKSEVLNAYSCIISEDGKTKVTVEYDSSSQSIVSFTLEQSIAGE